MPTKVTRWTSYIYLTTNQHRDNQRHDKSDKFLKHLPEQPEIAMVASAVSIRNVKGFFVTVGKEAWLLLVGLEMT